MSKTDGVEPLLVAEDLIPDIRLADQELDAFGHREIAGRVAEVAGSAEAPTNIALFGAWGSGKSSFYELLRQRLKKLHPEVVTVRYDAWKFGGSSLKRNFLSRAASELGIEDKEDGRKFHRGLYASTRTVEFDPLKLLKGGRWKSYLKILAFALAVTSIVVLALAGVNWLVGEVEFWDEARRLAPEAFTVLGTILFAIGSAVKILDELKVEIEQSVPSEDEQFENLFKDLVEETTSSKAGRRPKRLLFFIDELDRCDKRDVVATLESLRTFLDHPSCVFVVAADREVLEAALTAAHQSTPVNEEEPYYSSASAYLDKIFQHQFTLPPLRGGRLTGFARELVLERGGLWAQLRETQPNERLLNDVVYALVPAHVRSPRRVKVLLNNYATTVRVCQARGIEWLARATEIAKLVVLQTEFPSLAADLHVEPRLPGWLLNPPAQLSPRQRQLLDKHQLQIPNPVSPKEPEAAVQEDAIAVTTSPPDPLLAGEDNPVLRNRQRDNLFRYLQSREAAGVPNPTRDLLHLESAGYMTGIEDPELAQMIEDRAANEPDDVISALKDQPPPLRIQAARLVGEMSEREFGPERKNMITALTGILEDLAPGDLDGSLGDLLRNVQSYRSQEPLALRQMPGALVLALADPGGAELRHEILAQGDLLTKPETLARLAQLLPSLSDDEAKPVEEAVAEHAASKSGIILDCLATHPATSVARLIRNGHGRLAAALKPPAANQQEAAKPTSEAPPATENSDALMGSVNSSEEAAELVRQLFTTLQERGSDFAYVEAELLSRLLWPPTSPTYEVLREVSDSLRGRIDDAATSNSVGLAGLRACPADDWPVWHPWLRSEPERQGGSKKAALGQIVKRYSTASPDARAIATEIVATMAEIGGTSFQQPTKVLADVEAAIGTSQWWADDETASRQGATYRFLSLLTTSAPDIAKQVNDLVLEDLNRLGQATWDMPLTSRLRDVIELVETETVNSLREVVREVEAASGPVPATTAVILSAVSKLKELGATADMPPAVEVVSLATERSPLGDRAIEDWLRLDPKPADVVTVLAARGQAGTLKQSITSWGSRIPDTLAAHLLLDAFDNNGIHADWFQALEGVTRDPEAVLEGLRDRMSEATTAEHRRRVIDAVRVVSRDTFQAQKTVAQMALDLLTLNPSKTKADTASRLIEMARGRFGGQKGKLTQAATEAEANGYIDKSTRSRLERAGMLKKRKKGLGKLLQRD